MLYNTSSSRPITHTKFKNIPAKQK